jgi:nicotinate phosphoribosyltransferase
MLPTYSATLTDQYQLTMAYGYWKTDMAEREAVFYLTFRTNPFRGPYAIACGLETVIKFLTELRFTPDDIAYLSQLKSENKPLFPIEFLDYLQKLRFTCDLAAIPEGTLVFAKEPLLRIKGSLLQCQLLETPLLNFINFATLIATKATHVCQAAKGDSVIEFGLRRAQGPDGGLTASRSAYIGGCTGTSNVLAGKIYDIPTHGTQAHSWIMAFPDELTSFQAFANLMKNKTVLLVDTYDSVQGIKNAIQVAKNLNEKGYSLAAIRLDSGDLLQLSQHAREQLDAAGFQNTQIIASGDLDENIIRNLKAKNAPINSWGVGTKLVTAYDQPALNTIYKLAAIRGNNGQWTYKMKISDQKNKMTMPGILQVKRYYTQNHFVKDIIYDVKLGIDSQPQKNAEYTQDLLIPIFQKGQLVYQSPNIHHIRKFCMQQVQDFSTERNDYPVEIENRLKKVLDTMALT